MASCCFPHINVVKAALVQISKADQCGAKKVHLHFSKKHSVA